MRVRGYRDEDFPAVVEAVAGWIAAAGRAGYDHVGEIPHRIYENLRGRYPVGDVVRLWADEGGIAGLAICRRFGNAFDVFTAPRLRGTEAEAAMIRHAVEVTAAGTSEEYVLTDVWDSDAARVEVLERLGFEYFRVWDDIRERDLARLPPVSTVDRYVVRSATLDDAGQLAEARNQSFGEDWTGRQYRDAVMTKPGYDPAREIVAVTADGRVAAYTVWWSDPVNGIGHFEPVGTHREFQRQGLGRAVMLHAMHAMRAAGLTRVTVNHNAENVPAEALYTSLGFVGSGRTLGFKVKV
ncbi:GNAT family N-acetyltransferase [Longispora albida]|uniref:GNAT family N-acetyltransferase n=1 Tax=Longispora albida TaxID=203523 RepID=UPI0003A2D812|nr:GNAT family N-acetyltransferase [Longispora albida]